jgi:hypothetical protein
VNARSHLIVLFFSVAVCRERRGQLKEERPDLQFGKLGARLGEMWRCMSAEEKKPYEIRASGDRDRYKAEMGSYQSANMLKGNAMQQLGLTDEMAYNQHNKKMKTDDGSALGIDYGQLDPAQIQLMQEQQQNYLSQLQQSQLAQVMQQQIAQQQAQAAQQAQATDAQSQAATAGGKANESEEEE